MLLLPLAASGRKETEPNFSGSPSSVTLPETGTIFSVVSPQPEMAQQSAAALSVASQRPKREGFGCTHPACGVPLGLRVLGIMCVLVELLCSVALGRRSSFQGCRNSSC